jgi:hypothetical protein
MAETNKQQVLERNRKTAKKWGQEKSNCFDASP